VTAGDHVTVTGVLHIDQVTEGNEKSQLFDLYMDGVSVEIEDEQFEDMDITDEDKKEIIELSNESGIYDKMVGAIAPSIYGYEREKLAMILQLFSGVTKTLPDESRIRGDLHMLLIGDPGTGKCVTGATDVTLADGSRVEIRDLVESNLDDPKPIDDGVYDDVNFEVPSLQPDGSIDVQQATKVWKRAAPDELYRVTTATGREATVTPSHPLFVQSENTYEAVRAAELSAGDSVAVAKTHASASSNQSGRAVADGGVSTVSTTDTISSIERIEPDDEWVYDLEVEGTHNYLTNGIVSHNSQMISYIQNIAPRSVYTSGKGSSSAGLCVTGDTLIHTEDGLRPIRDIAESEHPEPVQAETAAPKAVEVQTFDREAGTVTARNSSHVWRMPEKPCRRIETSHGKELEASVNTPVLVCGETGIEWREMADVVAGDYVAVPKFTDVERDDPDVRDYLELGSVEPLVEEAVDADLRWDEVVAAVDTEKKEVFDLTVPETHNFVANGVVTHNTAAAVRDDFGEGQQWTLEAGALVLADQGIAAVDELDKMRCVTGETLVHCDDRVARIRELAHDAAEDGKIEDLPNGRTIRDVDLNVWTMTDDESLVERPVTAIHEYDAPDVLTTVTLESGERVTATPDHPCFVCEDGERTTRPAAELEAGNLTYVPRAKSTATDGGVVDVAPPERTGEGDDVVLRRVESVTETTGRQSASDGDPDREKVYDLTVSGTHNFVANGMVVHNSEDRSAMHEALEQQRISVSKAGINATLKSRCSLLGAANPKYGRFDQYEPIGEQIDLEPALISRFDLIFTVTDQPDEDKDRDLAEHILQTNYAGELNTHRVETGTSNYTEEEVSRVTDEVAPTIEPDLLRKYIAYAKRNCFPTMTEEAKAEIEDFYVDLRAKGTDEDAPVPVTARKLEALVRLAEASARVRLSDRVEEEDAERATNIARYCLEQIGMDPETGEFDADVVETGQSKSQRDRIKNIRGIIAELEDEYDEGAPVEVVIERAEEVGMDAQKANHEIEKLKQKGEVYEPQTDHLRTT
jgi:DNA replicative helicase MCM subunit Mcm2 (Cdc46/Mcm family)